MSTLGSKTVATPSAFLISFPGVQFMSSITSATSAPASNPTQALNSGTLQDIATIHSRRLDTIVDSITGTGNLSNIPTWITDLQEDGKWLDSDMDYTTGCDGWSAGQLQLIKFPSVILIPGLVAESCLLLNDTLTYTQLGNCSNISLRAYGAFDHRYSFEAGANILDMAKTSLDQSLLVSNVSLLSDAYRRVHDTIVVQENISTMADGIQPDGSFSQYRGLLYNGNYGNDFSNDILIFETAVAGTSFAAGGKARAALETLTDGNRWMITFDVETQDFSPVGRFISSPVADGQASSGILVNFSRVEELGEQWNSDVLVNFATSFSSNTTNANAGGLLGNCMFYNNDYMVTRDKHGFFLEDGVQYVMVANISSKTDAPVFSVLDQRRFRGPNVPVNGMGTVGGTLQTPTPCGTVTSGIFSGQETMNLFAVWLHHKYLSAPISYAVYPAVDYGTFALKRASTHLTEIQNDASVNALLNEDHYTVFGVFWDAAGGSFTFTDEVYGSMKIE
ncbi:chondroitin AC/alginate lyase [Suillus subaureus]|uniref:Chondroitin AC/alginate lyase n=1 Tax=Suillus subaureus TaxID=48587 RepID=A0A9P7JJ08_9AGAM|nr:chondroitin AC/alginate lyase [Suillus subaureus]KAG1825522.1 chondroitin AC/alginate lyase [Suillus subaureus]